MAEHYEVIYNTNYGGFKFPFEFLEAVFRAYPPDSEIGSKLWDPCNSDRILRNEGDADPSWDSFQVIAVEKPFYHGYKRLITNRASKDISGNIKIIKDLNLGIKYCYYTKDYVNYYFFSQYETEWRDSPHIIELAKKFGMFEEKEEDSYVESSDDDSSYDGDEDDEEEDEEEEEPVLLDDSNEMEIVTRACKGKTDFALKQVPIGYDYRIDEYDGRERVVILFPYKKVIQELLEARRLNSDDGLGPISKKLINGALLPNNI